MGVLFRTVINMVKQDTKKWYESKTLWVNALMFLTVFLTDLIQHISAENAVTILAVANIALRVVTKTKLN